MVWTAVLIAALVPRVAGIGSLLTFDEAYHWFGTSGQFVDAVVQGTLRQLPIFGHPGVTTFWLGGLGQALAEALGVTDGSAMARALLRLPSALVSALGVALAYPLVVRLLGSGIALVACLLWAFEPFLVAHSRLLHMDPLLATFLPLSLMCALVAFRLGVRDERTSPVRRWALVASGVAGGLALLTKLPAVVLLPVIGLVAAAGLWRGYRVGQLGLFAREWLAAMVGWGAVVVTVVYVLWPALWVMPEKVVRTIVYEIRANSNITYWWSDFFMGQVTKAPGPLFYPVVIVLRATPLLLLGLVLAAGVGPGKERRLLALVAAAAIGFIVMMSPPDLKMDRYVLPIFPLLAVIAAAGLVWAYRRWRSHRRYAPAAALGLAAVLAAQVAWYHPYQLAFYNPLLGGGRTAVRSVSVGWGEGMEQAGAFLSAQPGIAERRIGVYAPLLLAPFTPGEIVPLVDDPQAISQFDYVVVYVDQILRAIYPTSTAWVRANCQPAFAANIHGINYATVYAMRDCGPIADSR
jgi:4-amino-4-deoxy-L-arabinose transferase-like glycosyltransferase